VWAILARDMFLKGEYNKLKEKKISHCKVLQIINDNAYRICLPHHLKISDVFNVHHLSSYLEEHNTRTSSLQPRENDVVGLAITGDSRQPGVGLSQLDEDLVQIDYVNDLTDAFMDQWDKSRSKRRSSHARRE
jgi:hypothetical protein